MYRKKGDICGGIGRNFHKYQINILLGDFNKKNWGEVFSNRQFGMRVYMMIVMIMVSE